jgi:hypothetical protein
MLQVIGIVVLNIRISNIAFVVIDCYLYYEPVRF